MLNTTEKVSVLSTISSLIMTTVQHCGTVDVSGWKVRCSKMILTKSLAEIAWREERSVHSFSERGKAMPPVTIP